MQIDEHGKRWFIAPTGNKAAYACPKCGELFTVSDKRRVHMMEHAKKAEAEKKSQPAA